MSKTKKEFKDPALQFPQREEGKLNVYFHVSENSGVGYYRQYLPALALRASGLAKVMVSDFKWGEGEHIEPDWSTLFDIANWADIIVVGRKDIPQFYAQWGGIREFFKLPIVIDTDDNVQHVRPSNPGYEGYHPGAEANVWNKYGIAKVFDAVTVSTQDLKDFYLKDNPRIYLLPNQVDVQWFEEQQPEPKNDGFIRIGFIGSAAHSEGVNLIKKPVLDIMTKYPNVKFCTTYMYQGMFADAPEDIRKRIEVIPWIPLKEWPKGLKNIGLDIGLAPLADNLFNRAKSNLRWMEYSASHIATIASPVKPYLCINSGKDGILAKERDEWFNAIEKLVTDEKLRKEIADNAFQRVSTEFSIYHNIGLWNDTYKEIASKYHDFYGRKKKFLKVGNDKYKEVASA